MGKSRVAKDRVQGAQSPLAEIQEAESPGPAPAGGDCPPACACALICEVEQKDTKEFISKATFHAAYRTLGS